jgi:glutathione synthase/RimK-type ligase-like ATP-grasp enzyme
MRDPLLLIVGGQSDPNTRRIVDQAHLHEINYFFWDTDRPQANRIAWDFDSPRIDLGDDTIEPTAVFLRYNVFDGNPDQNLSAFELVQAFVYAWPNVRVLNRDSMADSNNKSRNLRIATDVGLEIPQTLVLGDLTPLSTIPDPAQRAIKPLSGGAHTQAVENVYQDIETLSALGPQFVQTKLQGENLRLFVIGGKPFCFHLKTTKLDYRDDDSVTVHQVDTPSSIVQPSMKLIERIAFDYCALDFRCRREMDEPVFLEVNSFPMFVRFDDAGQNCLADAMLEFLVGKQG